MAKNGAKHIVAMSRSGYNAKCSQRVLNDLYSEGYQVDLAIRDVYNSDDVRRAFKIAAVPVGGIIQGATVLRVSRCWTVCMPLDTDVF